MQILLNKIGECSGCVYFNRMYDHEKCRYCERNPNIAQFLKDNKTKPDKGMLPEGVFTDEQKSALGKLSAGNKDELAAMGVDPTAVDRMIKSHDMRDPPATRRRR